MKKYLTVGEVEILHKIINSIPDRDTFVHGDIHPKNIMVQDDELLFIDMADLTYGHPVFDYLGMALTHILSGDYCYATTGVNKELATDLFNNSMNSVFAEKSKEEVEKIKKVITGLAMLKYTISPAISKNQPEDLNKMLMKKSREIFFPMAEKLIGAVDF